MGKVFIIIILISAGSFFLFRSREVDVNVRPPTTPLATNSVAVSKTASFKIVTNGTVRIFTDKKYHNQSVDVYLTAQNPELVYIKKEGIKWSDFFSTLPMKLTRECLTTGTGQVFCTNSQKYLKFYINGKENNNALDEIINDNDSLLVEYK